MSMETHVFFRGKLPTKAALSRAMKELGFPLSIKPATGSLEQQSGFMPMLFRREETGVEFDIWNDQSAVAEFADVGVDPSFERVADFRWAGDFQEAVAGMCAAAALAKLMNGVVFDEAEDRLLSIDDATLVVEPARPRTAKKPGLRSDPQIPPRSARGFGPSPHGVHRGVRQTRRPKNVVRKREEMVCVEQVRPTRENHLRSQKRSTRLRGTADERF